MCLLWCLSDEIMSVCIYLFKSDSIIWILAVLCISIKLYKAFLETERIWKVKNIFVWSVLQSSYLENVDTNFYFTCSWEAEWLNLWIQRLHILYLEILVPPQYIRWLWRYPVFRKLRSREYLANKSAGQAALILYDPTAPVMLELSVNENKSYR